MQEDTENINNYDEGTKCAFDAMTKEIGLLVDVYPRKNVVGYENQEAEDSERTKNAVQEWVSMQELDSTHEMVAAGQLNVGDVKFTFKSDSIIEPEGYVKKNDNWYKVLELTKVRGINKDEIMWIRAFGKKVPMR